VNNDSKDQYEYYVDFAAGTTTTHIPTEQIHEDKLEDDKLEDDKLEEKRTRAYSRVVGYVKRQD